MSLKEKARDVVVTTGATNAAKNLTKSDGPLKSPAGIAAAGAALAAIPFVTEKLGSRVAPKLKEKAGDFAEEAKDKATAGVKDAAKDALPDGGGGNPLKKLFSGDEDGDGDGQAAPGYGSGRRMPIQQAVDVAVPVKQAYNLWTQFEDWPEFMHRIDSAEQEDDSKVSFEAKIWGISKKFEAEITEQRPDKRIEWNVTDGYAHTGVVTFHPLSDSLTRVEISLDVQPSGLIDKASRGLRFTKRAVRGDLHRFKAYAELNHDDVTGWRGTIEDGKVKRKSSSSSRSRSRNGSGPNGSSSRSKSKSKS